MPITTTHANDAVNIAVDGTFTPARLLGFDAVAATVEVTTEDGTTSTTIVASDDVMCAQCGNWETIMTCQYKQRSRYNQARTGAVA